MLLEYEMEKIELLAPAKNCEYGMAAIDCGADAVYTGFEKFGARAGAGNSMEDISKLADYSHKYLAKVYVTVNTIFYDEELAEVEKIIHDLYNAGVDAIIVQDMSIFMMDLPPIEIHMSTQANNYDHDRIKFFDSLGVQRIVLAREMDIRDIKKISEETLAEFEFFIQGALCVSLSGQCYLSEYGGGRSGNRGDCAQPCRKTYDLIDGKGRVIQRNRHLLCIRDLSLAHSIPELMGAGITSFKIEGRLKDLTYLKNTVSFYSDELDRIVSEKEGIERASSGRVTRSFESDLNKTFNRGYTDYFIHGRKGKINSFHTPKHMGEYIGKAGNVFKDSFEIETRHSFAPGDGLTFLKKGELRGLKVNSVKKGRVHPYKLNGLTSGDKLYRNRDHVFLAALEKGSCERKVSLSMYFSESEPGFTLEVRDSDGFSADVIVESEKEISHRGTDPKDMIVKQLSRLGSTIFSAAEVNVKLSDNYHMDIKMLNDMRRSAVEKLLEKRVASLPVERENSFNGDVPYPEKSIDYRMNVSNRLAEGFYRQHGVENIERLDMLKFDEQTDLMTCRMCIKYELGLCEKYCKVTEKVEEPLYLSDGRNKYRLYFDCKECIMKLRPVR